MTIDLAPGALTPGVKTKFGRAQVYRYKNRIQEPKNPFERIVRHWGRDRRAQLYQCGPIPRELLVVTTDGVRCIPNRLLRIQETFNSSRSPRPSTDNFIRAKS